MKSNYKIFGRKKGRKKNINIIPKSFMKKIIRKDVNLNLLTNNIIDIGSGSGENSVFLAKKFPRSMIVACDTFIDGNINLCNKIYLENIKNIFIYNGNVLDFLDGVKKKNILNSIWILFPDPWPKKKHFKRRLINNDFLEKLIILLKKKGEIHIITDSQSYLRQILILIYKFKNYYLWDNQSIHSWVFDSKEMAETKFYKKAIKSSRKPIYIRLKKL